MTTTTTATPRLHDLIDPAELQAEIDGGWDAWQIDRFRRFLADKAAVKAEYAATLGQITPPNALAPFGAIPAEHAADAELVRLWAERAARLRALIREYDAETRPEENL